MFAVSNEQASALRELVPHTHARGQLFGSSLGLLTVETDTGRWLMPPERALWVPPRMRHAALARGPAKGWSLYLAPHVCAALPAKPVVVQVNALLRELVRRMTEWGPPGRPFIDAEERLCAVAVDEIRAAPQERLHLPLPRSKGLLHIARTRSLGTQRRDVQAHVHSPLSR